VFQDLIIGIIGGLISGPISGVWLLWYLRVRVPRLGITVIKDDRIRVAVKNLRSRHTLSGATANSAVENLAELHIVNSIIEEPEYSRPIELRRRDPLIIKPEDNFVFVSRDTIEGIMAYARQTENEWRSAGRKVDNIGLRFRIASRDGLSGVAEIFEEKWRL
jgi:hypothetical protein